MLSGGRAGGCNAVRCCAGDSCCARARNVELQPAAHVPAVQVLARDMPVSRRSARRKQQMSLPLRRQLGHAPMGKKDEKRSVLLTEDLLEALQEART